MSEKARGGAEAEREAREKALDLLARREHSRTELAAKLTQRGCGGEAVERVLEGLERKGLLSDDRYAEQFVESRAARGQGPLRIAMELRRRGVDEADAVSAVAARDARWDASARAAREKKFGASAPKDYRERARQSRFLQQRGFTGDQIRAAFAGDGDDDA